MDLTAVRAHYAAKLSENGHTPQGVDWKDEAAQMDRLNALCLLFHDDEGFTLNDWGCGYGRLVWMTKHARYYGYDIVEQELTRGGFFLSAKPTKMADYTVASGLFNVMEPGIERDYWLMNYLWNFNKWSTKGFAFNMLHARANRKETGLFYADPFEIVEAVKQVGIQADDDISRWRFSILQHYSPWDFTILVNK